MNWIYLFIAAVFEVSWAIGLKYSEGLSKFIPSVLTIIAMLLSFGFLSLAVKHLPIGTAYSIWTGFGTVGTVILGMILFGEQVTPLRISFIILIVIGIIGLRITQ